MGSQNSIGVGTKPNSLVFFCIGLDADFQPVKGGMMVPAQPLVLDPFLTDAGGMVNLPFTWHWPGLTFYVQTWLKDAAGPKGFVASGGLKVAGQ